MFMIEAGLPNALRFIFFLVLIYYAFKLIVRILLPLLAKRSLNSFQKKFYEQNPHLDPEYQQKQARKEGEVHIKNSTDKDNNPEEKDLGEYIDFEEIKEKE